MTFRKPKNEADIQLLARMNQQLIRDEGHRNPMTQAELEQRMQSWLVEAYSALIIQHDAEAVGYVLFRRATDWLYLVSSLSRQHFAVKDWESWQCENFGKMFGKVTECASRFSSAIRAVRLFGNLSALAFTVLRWNMTATGHPKKRAP